MKYTMLAVVTALAVGAAVTAHAANERSPQGAAQSPISGLSLEVSGVTTLVSESSLASLNALFAEWDQAAFNAPGKPAQFRVYGRNGYVTTGGGYNYMVFLIRSAATDVREGRDRDAAPKIAKARSLLAASNLRKE